MTGGVCTECPMNCSKCTGVDECSECEGTTKLTVDNMCLEMENPPFG